MNVYRVTIQRPPSGSPIHPAQHAWLISSPNPGRAFAKALELLHDKTWDRRVAEVKLEDLGALHDAGAKRTV